MGGVLRFANKTMPHTWFMGSKESAQYDLAGQVFGAHDHLYKPEKVEPVPAIDPGADQTVERDRMRRMARRASGRDSTIRTGPQGAVAPYSAQPKSLLGS